MNLAVSRHWCPTGFRLAKSGAQKCKNWYPTGSRRDPDEIPTGSIDRQVPTPAPSFPFPDPPLPLFSFSAQCTNTPPSCTKTAKAVLSQTGVLQNISKYYIWHTHNVWVKLSRQQSRRSFRPLRPKRATGPNPMPYIIHLLYKLKVDYATYHAYHVKRR